MWLNVAKLTKEIFKGGIGDNLSFFCKLSSITIYLIERIKDGGGTIV